MKAFVCILIICAASVASLTAQETAFTYQGRLSAGGQPVNAEYEMQFTLFDSATNGAVVGTFSAAPVAVSNGLFNVQLDFGAAAFTGAPRWLEISVNLFGSDMIPTTLVPRQRVTAAPHALYANKSGSLAAGSNAPIVFLLDGRAALRLEPNSGDAANIVGGYPANQVAPGVTGAFIGGGGLNDGSEGNYPNRVTADYGTVVGGWGNRVQADAGFIGGGENNWIAPGALAAAIVGGHLNAVATGADESFIGGGRYNWIGPDSIFSVIVGGYQNTIFSNSPNSVIAGGWWNFIWPGGSNAIIAGGSSNRIAMGSPYSGILGGEQNLVGTNVSHAVVGGGQRNEVLAPFSSILGGRMNYVDDGGVSMASIVGGNGNWIEDGDGAFIGGGENHYIGGQHASVVGGLHNAIDGGSYTVIAGGSDNQIDDASWSSIVGGEQNRIEHDAVYSFVGGGKSNRVDSPLGTIGGGAFNAGLGYAGVIGGGFYNTNYGQGAVIGGGEHNFASSESVVGGGYGNVASGFYSTIGGGRDNVASNIVATVAGGLRNIAGGEFSFAAGTRAEAIHDGSFVWADTAGRYTFLTNLPFKSRWTNEFAVRATGGARFVTAIDGNGQPATGVELMPGSGTWAVLSDRNAKENVDAVNAREVLDKVSALPLATWNYKSQDKSIRHIGPMAQDFHAAFGLGENEKTITTVDADGVALAAIKGLNEKLEQELKAKEVVIRALEARLEKLERMVAQ